MKNIVLIVTLLMLTSCHPYRGFIESEFTLSPESQLPAWYSELPEGYTRDNVIIHLRYYTPSYQVDDTVFWVTSGWRTLYKSTGMSIQHPKHEPWSREDWPNRGHPSFVVITINGKTEVIEHRKMEPIFYISSEEAVKKVMDTDY